MVTIGITGSHASGKSFILDYLKSLEYKTLSADHIVKNLYENPKIRAQILELIPPLGEFNIRKIATLIYDNFKWREILQNFIHPFVVKGLIEFKNKNENEPIIFAEIPLLFESNFEKYFDFIITSYCSEESRLKRAKKRENFNEIIYRKIKKIQLSQKEKIKRAHFSINTDNNIEILKLEIDKLIKRLKCQL
jgi:dephospho-CoA kinase